jgi:hypothetical protein
MHRLRFLASGCLRTCALLLTLLCARAYAQAELNSVTVVGTFQSELGCASDWDPRCAITHLERNPADGVWRKVFTLPPGRHEFKVALNDSWAENYGVNAQRGGPGLVFDNPGPRPVAVKFFYDPVTHWVTNSSLTPIAVLAGSLQSELGCASDWDPACMLTWLKDLDGNGVQELVVPSLPAGAYELNVAHDESWDESHGANGEVNGANMPFTVPAPGQRIQFRYDTPTHQLVIQIAAPTTTTLTVTPNPVGSVEAVTFTARVTVDGSSVVPTGSVTFKADGEEMGTAEVGPDGTATLSSFFLPTGTYSITAEYGGLYEPSLSVPVVLQIVIMDGGIDILDGGIGIMDGGILTLDGGIIILDGGTVEEDAGTVEEDAGTSEDAGTDAGTDEDAGTTRLDAGSSRDAGTIALDAGTDAGSFDAGSGGTDAGSGATDAGSGGTFDAGSGGTDAGSGGTDAGSGGTDAGTGNTDAGTGNTDAGTGSTDAGTGGTDAGTGNTDAGTGNTDAGTGNTDAGTGNTDAGTGNTDAGTGNTDAGTNIPPLNEPISCVCGASSGGGSPLLLLAMWMGLTVLKSRRRKSARANR